jgi:hypothetical protein
MLLFEMAVIKTFRVSTQRLLGNTDGLRSNASPLVYIGENKEELDGSQE